MNNNTGYILEKVNNKLVLTNHSTNNIIDERDFIYKIYIKKYVEYYSPQKIEFKEELSYVVIKKIINKLQQYALEANFNFEISKELEEFITAFDLEIEIRKNLGIEIKNHNEIVGKKFNEFKNILENEMERKLREPQLWDAFHIISMIKSANFSVPGAGKTSIVYGAYAYLSSKQVNQVDKIVMIGPKNSFLAWKEEFVENFAHKRELRVLDTQDTNNIKSKKDKIKMLRFDSADKNLILINYEALEGILEVVNEIIDPRTMLVLDEAHKVKAIGGRRANAVLAICKNAKYKVALTGTPIPNSYQDIYNLLNILYTDEYNEFFQFTPKELKEPSTLEVKKINETLYPFYCRTTKKQLNVPLPNDDIILDISMTENEAQLFKMIHKKKKNNILLLYLSLLQASCNPKLLLKSLSNLDLFYLFGETDEFFDKENEESDLERMYKEEIKETGKFSNKEIEFIKSFDMTSKFHKGIDIIESLVKEGKQVIAWAIFIDTINEIKHKLQEKGIKSIIIDGAVPQNERELLIQKFKNGEIDVLISNPHTLAESVSLHKNCHDAIYFEYSFNLTHMLQSRDRINRLGLPQGQYTQYYYLTLNNQIDDFYNSIDLKTYNRLKEKERIQLEAIEGTSLQRINFDDMEDIKRILSGI